MDWNKLIKKNESEVEKKIQEAKILSKKRNYGVINILIYQDGDVYLSTQPSPDMIESEILSGKAERIKQFVCNNNPKDEDYLHIEKELVKRRMARGPKGVIKVPLTYPGGWVTFTGDCKFIFPKEGEIYDFRDVEWAQIIENKIESPKIRKQDPFNVAGKTIKILYSFTGNNNFSGEIVWKEISEKEDTI